MNKQQQEFHKIMGWKESHILKLTPEQMKFQLDINKVIQKLADEENMTRDEYLDAIHGKGFPDELEDN
tara:strand:- start:809 stop:1012 length:204 start_codon:yes stop_codon:yes gene_type:complete